MTTPHKNPAAVALGRKGGKAGRGDKKRRPREHYVAMGKSGGWPKGRKRKQRFASETKALTPPANAEKIPE